MTRLAVAGAIALLAISGASFAGIRGDVAGCAAAGQSCAVRLIFEPDAVTRAGPVSLFVGIVNTVNGEPNPAVAGWYDGRGWAASGMPKAAWTGTLSAPRGTSIAVPGGVCALVGRAGGPAGTYTVYAGWGARGMAKLDGMDAKEIEASMRNARPDVAAKYAQLLADYRAAEQQLAKYNNSDAVAFANMRSAGSFWQIKSFNCGG